MLEVAIENLDIYHKFTVKGEILYVVSPLEVTL